MAYMTAEKRRLRIAVRAYYISEAAPNMCQEAAWRQAEAIEGDLAAARSRAAQKSAQTRSGKAPFASELLPGPMPHALRYFR